MASWLEQALKGAVDAVKKPQKSGGGKTTPKPPAPKQTRATGTQRPDTGGTKAPEAQNPSGPTEAQKKAAAEAQAKKQRELDEARRQRMIDTGRTKGETRSAGKSEASKKKETSGVLGGVDPDKMLKSGPVQPGYNQPDMKRNADPVVNRRITEPDGPTMPRQIGRRDAGDNDPMKKILAAAVGVVEDEEKRRKRKGDHKGKFKELTWEQYNKLDKRTKSSVDFNTLLAEAQKKDRELEKKHGGVDKTLNVDEADEAKQGGYRKAYASVFGSRDNERLSKDMRYAPNTVALLNMLGVKESSGRIEEYLNGSGFITETDLKKKGHTGNNPYDDRSKWISDISEKMESFEKTIAKGRQIVNGFKEKVSLDYASRKDLGELVDKAAMAVSDRGDAGQQHLLDLQNEDSKKFSDQRFKSGQGFSLSSLLDKKSISDKQTYEKMRSFMTGQEGWSDKLFKDEKYLRDWDDYFQVKRGTMFKYNQERSARDKDAVEQTIMGDKKKG